MAKIHHHCTDLALIRQRIERGGAGLSQGESEHLNAAQLRKLKCSQRPPCLTPSEFPAVGSPQRQQHILSLQLKNKRKPAFQNFQRDLLQFLTYEVYGLEEVRGENRGISLDGPQMVCSSIVLHTTTAKIHIDPPIQGCEDSVLLS
jgi:hypothetical protein